MFNSRVICYDVYGRIAEGNSEHIGFFKSLREATQVAKRESWNYPLGVDIDFNVYDADSVERGEPDKLACQQTRWYVGGVFNKVIRY